MAVRGRHPVRLVAGALLLSILIGGSSAQPHLGKSPSASGRPISFLDSQSQTEPSTGPPGVVRRCDRPTLVGAIDSSHVTARTKPSPTAPTIATFAQKNPQGASQVFDLENSTQGADGKRWFRALLPIRPNGTSGYIPAGAVRVEDVSYRILVNREALTLTLWRGCRVMKVFTIGLGKESTPTPNGRFYIVSLLKPPTANSIYGNYAYGLSAYSEALPDWTGGGIIGIHGTNDPSSIGNRKSHGCIRMRNRDIGELVPLLPLGTPVRIV